MADINREAQEFAEIMADVNREMKLYGQLHATTAERLKDAEMKAKFGIDNFSKATGTGAEALIKLGGAAKAAAGASLDGSKKASSMNGAFDQLTDAAKLATVALTLLVPGGPLVKGLVAAFTLLAVTALEGANKYREAAVKISDDLYKGYSDLAQSGAAASDGMTGLFEDAKKLGYSMNELGEYTALIGQNSKDLALFSGTVFEGRQKFADMGKSFEKYNGDLIAAGLTQTQINEGMMGYLKLQSRVGLSQNKTTAELADGAKKYLIEMDALSKVTGESRKAMEDQMEAARSEERFAAKLQELRSQGPAGIAAAKELELTNLMLAKENKQLAQGFRDASTGMITTEAAQKAMLVTQGQVMVQSDRMSAGLAKAGEGATIIGQAAGNTAKSMTGLAKAGAYIGADFAADLRSGQTDYNKALIEAGKEQTDQGIKGGKAADEAVNSQVRYQQAMRKANEQAERFVTAGMVPATDAATLFASSAEGVADRLNKLFGITPEAGPSAAEKAAEKTAKAASDAARAAEKTAQAVIQDKKSTKEERVAAAQKAFEAQKAERAAVNPGPVIKGAAPASVAPTAPAAKTPTGGGGGAAPISSESAPTSRGMGSAGGPAGGHAATGGGEESKPKLATVTAASGKSTAVNEKYAPAFQSLLDYLNKSGYEVNSLGGFVDRDVRGKPGVKSIHAHGAAIDINPGTNPLSNQLITDMPAEISSIAAGLGLGWGGNWKSRKDAMHFSAAQSEGGSLLKASEGGMFQGPTSGYNVELHGKEAVIPLKNGAVPVSLDLKQALSGPTFAGSSEYGGYNMGPMSTDIEAVKKLAEAVGAFDKTSQIITDPATWKQILSSGLATNYKLTNAELGTKALPGLDQDMADRLKEIKEQGNTTTEAALKQVGEELIKGMSSMAEQFAVTMTSRALSMDPSEMLPYLQELISATKNGVDVQQKILATSY